MIEYTKAQFLALYENKQLQLKSLIVTPLAVLGRTIPKKDTPEVAFYVNVT